jgi:PAS domain S-box-containing protein
VQAAVADAASGTFVRWEARFRRADGIEASLDLSIKPMLDERGAVHRLIVEGRDITERQAAEAALRGSEAKFAGILAIAADAIITVDEAQRIVHFNRGAEEIFGYAEREMLGRPLEHLIPERFRAVHDGHVARFATSGETARRMGERREVYGLRRDGTEFPADASISVLQTTGERLLTVVLRDITERRRAESRQRFLAEAGAALADSLEYEPTLERVARLAVPTLGELCIVDVLVADEEAASAVAHVDPEQEALVRTMRRRSPPPRDGRHPVAVVRRTGEPLLVHAIDAPLLDTLAADAGERGLLAQLAMQSALHVPLTVRGETIGVLSCLAARRRLDEDDLALASDLAHHAALAIDNARSYRAAQRATRARDEVLGIVSHDLRNPISAVGMCAAALSAGPPAEEVARIADVIRGSATWMQSIIRDLLDVTAIEAGGLSVRPEPTPPAVIVETLHAMHAPEAAERGVHLATRVAPEATLVEADADRVVQPVGNLLGNAIKFTPPGGRVALAVAPCGEGEVAFHVSDSGPGIAADDIPRLFDRFWQARTTRRGGAGLGLAIARGIAEAHGGRIEVRSEPGQGSHFMLVLRAVPSGAPTRASFAGADQSTPSAPGR